MTKPVKKVRKKRKSKVKSTSKQNRSNSFDSEQQKCNETLSDSIFKDSFDKFLGDRDIQRKDLNLKQNVRASFNRDSSLEYSATHDLIDSPLLNAPKTYRKTFSSTPCSKFNNHCLMLRDSFPLTIKEDSKPYNSTDLFASYEKYFDKSQVGVEVQSTNANVQQKEISIYTVSSAVTDVSHGPITDVSHGPTTDVDKKTDENEHISNEVNFQSNNSEKSSSNPKLNASIDKENPSQEFYAICSFQKNELPCLEEGRASISITSEVQSTSPSKDRTSVERVLRSSSLDEKQSNQNFLPNSSSSLINSRISIERRNGTLSIGETSCEVVKPTPRKCHLQQKARGKRVSNRSRYKQSKYKFHYSKVPPSFLNGSRKTTSLGEPAATTTVPQRKSATQCIDTTDRVLRRSIRRRQQPDKWGFSANYSSSSSVNGSVPKIDTSMSSGNVRAALATSGKEANASNNFSSSSSSSERSSGSIFSNASVSILTNSRLQPKTQKNKKTTVGNRSLYKLSKYKWNSSNMFSSSAEGSYKATSLSEAGTSMPAMPQQQSTTTQSIDDTTKLQVLRRSGRRKKQPDKWDFSANSSSSSSVNGLVPKIDTSMSSGNVRAALATSGKEANASNNFSSSSSSSERSSGSIFSNASVSILTNSRLQPKTQKNKKTTVGNRSLYKLSKYKWNSSNMFSSSAEGKYKTTSLSEARTSIPPQQQSTKAQSIDGTTKTRFLRKSGRRKKQPNKYGFSSSTSSNVSVPRTDTSLQYSSDASLSNISSESRNSSLALNLTTGSQPSVNEPSEFHASNFTNSDHECDQSFLPEVPSIKCDEMSPASTSIQVELPESRSPSNLPSESQEVEISNEMLPFNIDLNESLKSNFGISLIESCVKDHITSISKNSAAEARDETEIQVDSCHTSNMDESVLQTKDMSANLMPEVVHGENNTGSTEKSCNDVIQSTAKESSSSGISNLLNNERQHQLMSNESVADNDSKVLCDITNVSKANVSNVTIRGNRWRSKLNASNKTKSISFQDKVEGVTNINSINVTKRKRINSQANFNLPVIVESDNVSSEAENNTTDNDDLTLNEEKLEHDENVIRLKSGKWRRSLSQYRRQTLPVAHAFVLEQIDVESTNQLKTSLPNESNRQTLRHSVSFNLSRDRFSDFNETTDRRGIRRRRTSVYNPSAESRRLIESEFASTYKARDTVLRKCGQSEPLEFDEVYSESALRKCRKIGEGVYGEVFMNKTDAGRAVVLKIIPIEGTLEINGEPQKKFDEILSEIIIAQELSSLRNDKEFITSSFTEVVQVRCVQGRYPEHLIDLWELYRDNCQTENDHPEIFTDDQLYIVLELANGGQDLEAFQFTNALQSKSALQQTSLALAIAEKKFQFEHRDLHWGNILLAPTDEKFINFKLNGNLFQIPSHGIKVTIIDYTLSRMRYEDVVLYNDLSNDDELFTAHGDYQFDIYRLMKSNLDNDWRRFEPFNNVLWLHYITDKLINGARYKNSKSHKHRAAIEQLMVIRDEITNYKSAAESVTNV